MHVRAQAAGALAAAMSNNSQLLTLHLDHNEFGPQGATALASTFQACTVLRI
jgi:hypothetical protein